MRKIDFNKGSLSFLIPERVMDYGDNKFINLVNYNSKDGSLKIVKDKDNGLKVFYDYKNNGRCFLEASTKELDDNDEHEVAVTWSLSDREVILYIDGEEIEKCEIDISP